MNKAVFLDRDGTVNIDKNYMFKVSDFEFEKNVLGGLKYLHDKGYKLIVVSNQSGIARGYFTEEDVIKLHNHLAEECLKNGFEISGFYFCPHHEKGSIPKFTGKCNCRKPETGLIDKAVMEHDIDVSVSYMIGDKESDIMAGKNAGLKTILVGTGYGSETLQTCKVQDYFVNDLSEIRHIIQ